jgi:hypothetical protein
LYPARHCAVKKAAVTIFCRYPALNNTSHDFRSIPGKRLLSQRTVPRGCFDLSDRIFTILYELQILKYGLIIAGIIVIDFAPFLPEYIPLPFFHSTNSFATNSGRASWFHEKLK